ncbi:hypothetical protein Ms3S1_36800 [Methylosinus sp. 3S-1]
MTEMVLVIAVEAMLSTEELTFNESLIVDSTPWSDFIVCAMPQVEALSAALEILRPVEISFCVVASDDWVERSDWSAVMAEEFVRILDMTHRSLDGWNL